jgi:NADH:ubiquinone oxidoreductase subunit 6 (subunit J)
VTAAVLVMLLTAFGAVLAVTQGSIVRAIFGLAIALAGVALAFLLLGSPFVAAMEVLIYIGGITVAMAFGVMLSSAGNREARESVARRAMAGVGAAVFFAAVALVIVDAEFAPTPETDAEAWGVKMIGRELLDRFNVVFEALSVALLLAIVGAIVIAARRHEDLDPTLAEDQAP